MGFDSSEYLTAQFYAWERVGRGWSLFDHPVHLEPEFFPFEGHFLPEVQKQIDTGRRPRFFPELQEVFGWTKKEEINSLDEFTEKLDELYPINAYQYESKDSITELELKFGNDFRTNFDTLDQLLLMLSSHGGIICFEIIGTGEELVIQFACASQVAERVKGFINIYLPELTIQEKSNSLFDLLVGSKKICVTNLGLQDEFMRPIRVWQKFEPDPIGGCIAALEAVKEGELGALQIMFQGAINPWSPSIGRAVSDASGGAFFADDPDMSSLAKEKISKPLFAVAIRTIGQAEKEKDACDLSYKIAQSFLSYERIGSNSFVPLGLKEGETSFGFDDLIFRTSRRVGMLLNSGELASMVHVPDASIKTGKLRAFSGKTKQAPNEVIGNKFALGLNTHLGVETDVTLSDNQRLRHTHIIGSTGTGKSTLLVNMVKEDMLQGKGVTVLDPHGDLIDDIISHVPKNRLKDVILLDPSDVDYPIGLNLFSAENESEKIVLSSDLVSIFRRFATSWGDQMTSVLANAINAILESDKGGTLIDLRRFLVESKFRNKFLENVSDPSNLYYWQNEFRLLKSNSISPILTRLDTFLRPKVIRNMMAIKKGLNFNSILNTNKILLIKLSQGQIGEENSYILGTLLITKLQQAASNRANIPKEERTPYYLYVDEFQNFITPSMTSILSGARKYGLGLVLAHQDLEQLKRKDSELANSVLANPSTRICFRCGDKDSKLLEDGFSFFESNEIQNLSVGEALVRVGGKKNDFNISFDLPVSGISSNYSTIQDFTREQFACEREAVEKIIEKVFDIVTEIKAEKKEFKTPVVDVEAKTKEKPIEKEILAEKSIVKSAKEYVEKESKRLEKREHLYIQEHIKKMAQDRGFKAVIEEPINKGEGRVDVGLTKDNIRIACEISVTTSNEHEVGNIKKCLNAGYNLVFACSKKTKDLSNLKKLCLSEFNEEQLKTILFVNPEELVSYLDSINEENKPKENIVKGYRVKVNYKEVSDTKGKLSREIIAKILLNPKKKK